VLLSITVLNTNDSGGGSLRQAIIDANTTAGADTIVFDSTVFNTPRTITLTSGELGISDDLAVQGPGANLLSVSGNQASRVFQIGAGVTASISGLTITGGSTVDFGGGLFNGGAMTLTDCTVSGNSAGAWGGGLWNSRSGSATLINCTVSGNSATDGGGMFIANGGSATLINCTVSGNSAIEGGGGLFDGSVLTLINCTVSGNSAVYGGGLFDLFTSPATLTNTIVAGNSGGDIFGDISGSNNIIGVADPGLAPLGDYGGPTQTMALLPGSPAIDAGTSTGAPTTDQRGIARPPGGAVDIGAYESRGFSLAAVPGTTPQSAAVNEDFGTQLGVQLNETGGSPLPGAAVTFTAPGSGASATFSPVAPTTDASGQAKVTATANATVGGPYTVTATVAGLATTASFSLTNTPGAPASVAVVSGSAQSATVGAAFASPLVVVVKDAYGNPVPGASVTFTPPSSGASAIVAGSPATTGSDGRASITATANGIGGAYTVTASVAGVATPATFNLANAYNVVALFDQTKPSHSGSTIPIKVKLTDAAGNNVGSSSVELKAVSVVGPSGTLQSPGNSQPGNLFKFDPATGTYQFNLKTTGYTKGSYTLNFTIGNDPTLHSIDFVIG
jgi:hypothetical protein